MYDIPENRNSRNTGETALPLLLEKCHRMLSAPDLAAGWEAVGMASLLERLREGRFHLAVLGQFKRGKSTLLNALVGEPILPVSVVS